MERLTFSGHESFICKQFWLKKGFDFTQAGNKFSGEDAVVGLGVGKNMVNAIQFWLNAFGIYDTKKQQTSDLGDYLFGENGKDLYLEDLGSVWLLHYYLIKTNHATIYNLVFNDFRAYKTEFTKLQLHNYLKRKCTENSKTVYNANTIDRDIKVFLDNYEKPNNSDIEDSFTNLLHELKLVKNYHADGNDWYRMDSATREELPFQIVLFSILDNENYGSIISFNDLLISENSPGRIFALNAEGLYQQIQQIVKNYKGVVYSETAGNRTLQIDSNLKTNKWKILDGYYNV